MIGFQLVNKKNSKLMNKSMHDSSTNVHYRTARKHYQLQTTRYPYI